MESTSQPYKRQPSNKKSIFKLFSCDEKINGEISDFQLSNISSLSNRANLKSLNRN